MKRRGATSASGSSEEAKRHVLVVGAGVAGLAAAWSAARAGRAVTIAVFGAGASAFGGGAVDALPWERLARAARTLGAEVPLTPIAPEVLAFARALGIWDLPEADAHAAEAPLLATASGRVRPARGRDHALLDLGALGASGVIGVAGALREAMVALPRVDRAGWDADALAATLGDDPLARARRLTFVAVDAPILRFDEERRIADGDLAARHDDEARLGWLAARLREALGGGTGPGARVGAVLLGPWLGAREARAAALTKLVGVPVGEALVGVGSPAGLRFEAARDRLLDAIGARVVRDRVTALAYDDGKVVASLARGAALAVDAAVLAVGGVAGGGVIYAPPEHTSGADLPVAVHPPFTLSLRAPVALAARSRLSADVTASRPPASMHGPELDETAWPSADQPGALESVGVVCDGARAADRMTAAGDVIAGQPRTLLTAVASGLRAGREA